MYIKRERVGLKPKQATSVKQNPKMLVFRCMPWLSAAGGSLPIIAQRMCKRAVTIAAANTDDAIECASP